MKRVAVVTLLVLGCLAGAAPAGANAQATGVRVAGADRIATSVAVSQTSFPKDAVPGTDSAKAVLLARADGFADALAGTPLAVAQDAPLLLTNSDSLDPRVAAEIRRVLNPGLTVYILGSQLAISDAVSTQLTTAGYTVTRVGGADRYQTAVLIAKAQPTPKVILLATGNNPGDALPGGAAAAAAGGVVLLTNDSTMPAATQQFLTDNPGVAVFALGGPAASADPSATPIAGADRYATSVLVAQQFFQGPKFLGFANGFAYPDALSGGAAMGELGGPLLLIAPDNLPDVVHQYAVGVSPTVTLAEIYGGKLVIPDGVLAAIDSAIRGT